MKTIILYVATAPAKSGKYQTVTIGNWSEGGKSVRALHARSEMVEATDLVDAAQKARPLEGETVVTLEG